MYTPIDTTLYNYGVIKQGQGAAAAYNYGFLSQAASGKAQYVTKIGYNYGIIASTQNGQLTGKQFGKLYNYGIILSGSYSGDSGQSIGGFNTYAENNGIINAGAVGQSISNKARSKEEASNIVNKGTIFTKLSGQKIFGEGMYNASYNYGVISAVAENSTKTAVGQEITEKGENNKAFNFGKIIGDNGQKLSSQAGYGSSAYNYGTIETTSKGQYVAGMQADQTFSNDKVYNYGTINAGNGVGQYLEKSGEIYNFGIIKNDGTDYAVKVENAVDEKYKAENYGVIDLSSKDNGKAFSGNIINRGFVITQNL